MKGQRTMMKSGFPTFDRYLPSPQIKQLILNYFKYNNFQDFNTWQQIARAKLEYQYQEIGKGFCCKIKLKWNDRTTPMFSVEKQARGKKNAKKKALTELVDLLICQGFIHRGFREQNFLQKLPRRRKNASDSSSDEEIEDAGSKHNASILLSEGKFQTLLNKIMNRSQKNKYYYLYECWNYGLKKKSLTFLQNILEALNGREVEEWSIEPYKEMSELPPRQIFDGTKVKEPLREDLTDFISSYQLQKELKPVTIRRSELNMHLLPSQNVLIESKTYSPSQSQLIEHFQPISSSKLYLKSQQIPKKTFLGPYQTIQIPRFQGEEVQVSINCLELLYSLLLFYCQDYGFFVKVLNLLETALRTISIRFKLNVSQIYYNTAEKYYLKHKYLLTAQFLETLCFRVAKIEASPTIEGVATSIEGMLKPIQGEEHFYWFTPTEIQQKFIQIKLQKNNFSQFQEGHQISTREFVSVISKFGGKWIGQITEITPSIRVHIPSFQHQQPHPVTLVRLYNGKIFEKTSSSLVEASSKYMELLSERTFLLWQPPTYPLVTIIAELLVEWQTSKQTILIVSPNTNELNSELTNLGFKVVKITPKTQDKLLIKNYIVIVNPAHLCCELLKNYAYTRVLVESAQAVSQIRILSAIVKDCQQLWLIGDPYLPRTHISSQLCKKKGIHISLFERLVSEGRSVFTYSSKVQKAIEQNNVIEWANKYVYKNNLRPLGAEHQLPVIRGFPWPSYQYRVSFLHIASFEPYLNYLYSLTQICSRITEQVLKSGYTLPQQIVCSINELQAFQLLQWHLDQTLKKLGIAESKVQIMTKMVSGSKFVMSQLSILVVGSKSSGLGDILGGLLQGRRGVIFIGDCIELSRNEDWGSFLGWCKQNNLISSYRQ